jgi:hypothetical protein
LISASNLLANTLQGDDEKRSKFFDAGNTEMTAARDARNEVWSRRRQVNQNSEAQHEGWMKSSHENSFLLGSSSPRNHGG